MRRATRYVVAISLMLAATAAAQVTLWLENPQDPQAGAVTIEVGQSATIQLWLEVPEGTILVNVDAILRGLDASFAKDLNFEVVGFNDVTILDSGMQRVGRGSITEALPHGFIDDYQYVADDVNYPLDQDSGLPGPRTVLLDEIIIQGLDENTADGPDWLMFATGGQAPGGFEMAFASVPPPGTWSMAELSTIELGTGSAEDPFLVTVTAVGAEPPPDGGDGGGTDGGGDGQANENASDDGANDNAGTDGVANDNAGTDGMANDNQALPDSDNDSLSDEDEVDAGTDPNNEDTDDDGITDGAEVDNGLDPTQDDAEADDDSDGVDNLEEISAGTDPQNPDSDGDGDNDATDPAPTDPTVTSEAGRPGGGGGGGGGRTGGLCGAGLIGPLFLAVVALRLGRGRRWRG